MARPVKYGKLVEARARELLAGGASAADVRSQLLAEVDGDCPSERWIANIALEMRRKRRGVAATRVRTAARSEVVVAARPAGAVAPPAVVELLPEALFGYDGPAERELAPRRLEFLFPELLGDGHPGRYWRCGQRVEAIGELLDCRVQTVLAVLTRPADLVTLALDACDGDRERAVEMLRQAIAGLEER